MEMYSAGFDCRENATGFPPMSTPVRVEVAEGSAYSWISSTSVTLQFGEPISLRTGTSSKSKRILD
jgi:hypothetical protein